MPRPSTGSSTPARGSGTVVRCAFRPRHQDFTPVSAAPAASTTILPSQLAGRAEMAPRKFFAMRGSSRRLQSNLRGS